MRALRKNYRELLITIVAVLIAGYFTNSVFGFVSRVALPATDNGIHLGVAFDYSVSNPAVLSGKVDYVWGSSQPKIPLVATDAYLPFARDTKDTYIAGHDVATWQRNHPDWIVYKCDRVTPADPFPLSNGTTEAVPLDITNPAVRDYQMSYISQYLDAGYSGVGFDNIDDTNNGQGCGVYQKDAQGNLVWTTPSFLSSRANYAAAVVNWAHAMHDLIKAKYPNANMDANDPPISWDTTYQPYSQVTQYFDNVYDEYGFLGGGVRMTDGTWQKEVQAVDYINGAGKAVTLGNENAVDTSAGGAAGNTDWLIGNYLLVKGSRSYTYIYTSKAFYGTFTDLPIYHIPIGQPTGARYASQGVWMRNYTGGLVMVNPSSKATFTVRLTSAYTDSAGAPVASTIKLAPASAITLLAVTTKTPPPPPTKTPPTGTTSTTSPNQVTGTASGQSTGGTTSSGGKSSGRGSSSTGGYSQSGDTTATGVGANSAAITTSGPVVTVPTTPNQARHQIYVGLASILGMMTALVVPVLITGRRSA